MTIKELRELIQKYPDESVVIMSKDGEGNEFSPLADANCGSYSPETTWRGDFESSDEGTGNAVCLWPTN